MPEQRDMASKDQSIGPEGALPDLRVRSVVGVFYDANAAQAAYHGLIEAGFPSDDVSLLHRPQGIRPEVGVEQTHTGRATVAGLSAGVVIGGIAGLVALAIPGIGPLLAVGPIAVVLTGAGVGSALGGLVGSMAGLGIPTDEARQYEEAVRKGGTFLAVRSPNATRTEQARQMLAQHGAENLADFAVMI